MNVIERHFESIGARVKIREPDPPRVFGTRRNQTRITPAAGVRLNVRRDKKGEYFDIIVPSGREVEVIDTQPDDRHLLLLTRDDGEKAKFLCGHDERHWFVAAIPEHEPVTGVRSAKIALQPPGVRAATRKLKTKNQLRRKNEVFKRQGEWFFRPVPRGFNPDPLRIIKNERLFRSGVASKPHMMEYAYRLPGRTVYVATPWRGERQVLTAEQYQRLPAAERKRLPWRAETAITQLYAKGKISHSDHATIVLDDWHEVVMNTEQRAKAMSRVAFID